LIFASMQLDPELLYRAEQKTRSFLENLMEGGGE
jgi:hypothetical protein